MTVDFSLRMQHLNANCCSIHIFMEVFYNLILFLMSTFQSVNTHCEENKVAKAMIFFYIFLKLRPMSTGPSILQSLSQDNGMGSLVR